MRITKSWFSVLLIGILLISYVPVGHPLVYAESDSEQNTFWENAFTQTSVLENGRYNSTIFSFPKALWNGTQWVDHIFNSSDNSGGIGSTYIKVLPTHTVIYDPTRSKELVKNENWRIERLEESTSNWVTDIAVKSNTESVTNSSGVYFIRKTLLQSGSTSEVSYALTIGTRLKITLKFNPILSGMYRIFWCLRGVSGEIMHSPLVDGRISAKETIVSSNCSWARFVGRNCSNCFLDWFDTYSFDERNKRWITFFQKLEIDPDVLEGKSNVELLFGNFVSSGSQIVIDPTVVTVDSDPALDGYLEQIYSTVDTQSLELRIGQQDPTYRCWRSYISFDTSAIPSLAYDLTCWLWLKTYVDASETDFNLLLRSAAAEEQPIYGDSLEISDWGCGTVTVGLWNTAAYPGNGIYIPLSITAQMIDRLGQTQLELLSQIEGLRLFQNNYVCFFSANAAGNEPKLEVQYSLDTITVNEVTWFYRDAGGTAAAIVLFGASYNANTLWLRSIDLVSHDFPEKTVEKIEFLNRLIDDGISVLTVSHDSLPNDSPYYTLYNKDSKWVEEAALWLSESRAYKKLFIFGHSGGGVVTGYEIQKDFASRFSAAVITCGVVDADGFSNDPIWHTADTASRTKSPICFPEPVNDAAGGFPNIRLMMQEYFDNAPVQKEWHNWDDGHGFFAYTCLDHPGETASEVVTNWFGAPHPPSNPFTPAGSLNGHVYTSYDYSTGAFDANGDDIRYEFDWGDSTTNTTTFYSAGQNTSFAHAWSRPGSYNVKVRAQDSTQGWSNWSAESVVTITQNDADSGADAGDTFSTATSIGYGSYWECALYQSNPQDLDDYYKFYETGSGQSIYISMTPPLNQDFNLFLYNPNGAVKASSMRGPGQMEEISYTINLGGYWRIRVTGTSGEGQYSLFFGTAPPGGGESCPTLFSWNGTAYLDHGVIPIHNSSGQDIIRQIPLTNRDIGLVDYKAELRLREGWPGLNFSESYIDQVKLYAIDAQGNCHLCPLINATHGRLGNVLPRLYFSDDWKAQTLLLETIDLQFLVPYPNIQDYVFHIEGCNQLKQ